MDQNSVQKDFGSEEQLGATQTPITDDPQAETSVAESVTTEAVKATEEKEVGTDKPSTPEAEEPTTTPTQPESEVETKEVAEEANNVDTSNFSAEELLKYLDEMIKAEQLPDVQEMKRLKRLLNNQQPITNDQEELDEEVEDDGEERGEKTATAQGQDDLIAAFLNLKTRYHELEAKKQEEEKLQKEENYAKKQTLIQRLKDNLNSTDDFFKVRNEFQNIRIEWKNTGPVPDNLRSELLQEYSRLLDEYYTLNKLNKEAQDYDYKHNRKEKEGYIERAKALAEEKDVVKAFRELQTLHDLWKETGPVAPEFRDAMWAEFSDATKIINKAHDDYFKALHEQEDKNYEVKVKIIERLENMLIKLPTTRDEWRGYERQMDEIRKEWKAAGRVPRAKVNDLRLRFRVAVDEFYLQRRNFMKELSELITPRLERMRELAQEAEGLKDSRDWRATTKKMQEMQKEWTSIAQLGTRVAEAQRLWRKFRGACDTFFKRKADEHKERMASREENLEKKLLIADKIEALVDQGLEDPSEALAEIEAEWASVGPVPNEKKDEVLNRYYSSLRILKGERRAPRQRGGNQGSRDNRRRDDRNRNQRLPKVNLQKDLTELSSPELQDERDIIKRNITKLEEELLQYETNISFFNASPDNPMVMQVQAKIDDLRKKIEALQARIKEVKEEIKNPTPTTEELVAPEATSEATSATEAPAEEQTVPATTEATESSSEVAESTATTTESHSNEEQSEA